MALQPHGRWYPDVADLLNEYFSMEEPLFDFYGEGRRGDYYLYQVDYYGVPVAQILEIDDRTCLFHVGGEYRWISYNFGGNFSDFAVAFVNLVGDLWDKMQEMEKNQNDD